MTLYQIVSYLKQIALSSPYIRTAEEGSVYTIMNGNPHSKYGVFVVSQTLHRQDEIFDYYGLNLFVIDRLVDDLESNRLQIQSLAKEVLANTILTFVTKFYGITHNELQFHPFTEKFVDLTAGQYVQVTFQIPRSLICPDDYIDFYDKYRLLPLNVEITDNGIYEYTPVSEDYDGYDSVKITVNVPQTGASINNQTKIVEVEENGDYTITYDNGYTGLEEVNFKVDVSGYTQEDLDDAYESGITSGITYQKSLLQDITITHNGEYTNENGYSAITVNVPQTGESIYNQTKSIEYSGNGEYTLTYDEGYTGLEAVNINVNVPQSGYTEEDFIRDHSAEYIIHYVNHSLESVYPVVFNMLITHLDSNGSPVIDLRNDYTFNGTGVEFKIPAGYHFEITTKSVPSGYTDEIVHHNHIGEYNYAFGGKDIYISLSGDTPTPPTPSGETDYLTFEAIENGTLYFIQQGIVDRTNLDFCVNEGQWQTMTGNTGNSGTVIDLVTVQAGDKIWVRGVNTALHSGQQHSLTNSFGMTGKYNVYGNLLSIIYGDNYDSYNTYGVPYGLSRLFDSNLVSAENLIIPYPTGNSVFNGMFIGCSSLTTAPTLPATTLTEGCYNQMFQGCTSLTSAPELPATSLTSQCYNAMFSGCTSLNYVNCLAETGIDTNYSTNNWLSGVPASGTFTKKTGVTWPTGNNGIPTGWTVIEE